MRGYQKRNQAIREQRKVILIICEGKKTEIQYFRKFRVRYSNVEVIPLHEDCTDPKNIVEAAIDKRIEYNLDLQNGDGIWCVFDVDNTRNEDIINSCAHALANEINVALSNPSFELWFLLHFKLILFYIERNEVIDQLKNYIPNYTKDMDVYPLIIDNMDNAIDYAKKLNQRHQSNFIHLLCRDSNPSTQVFALVEFINETIEKNMEIIASERQL